MCIWDLAVGVDQPVAGCGWVYSLWQVGYTALSFICLVHVCLHIERGVCWVGV